MVRTRVRAKALTVLMLMASLMGPTTVPSLLSAQESAVPQGKSDATDERDGGDAKGSNAKRPDRASKLPVAVAVQFDLGLVELKRREFKKAIEAFDKVIAVAPDHAAAYAERGGARIGLGANELAVSDLTHALSLSDSSSPDRARIYGNRGLAYLNQSKHAQAMADFDRALEIDPKMAFAYANRAMSQMQRKNYEPALRDVTRALDLRPSYEFAVLLRAFVNIELKRFADAAGDFRRVLVLSPDNRGAILGLRQAYLAGKDSEEPAKIKLVRLADTACEPACPEWIAIDGKIEPGAAETLKSVLKETGKRKLPIFVDSGGGSVNDAMEMGRMIRALGLDVVVTRTELVSCARDDVACRKRTSNGRALGKPQSVGAICASSCGFLIAAGLHRFVGASTLVGVHQITSFQTYQKVYRQYEVKRAYRDGKIVEIDRRVVSETLGAKKTVQTATKDETYVKIRKYFTEMGIDDGIMGLLIAAPPKGMHWLSPAELKATAIMTDAAQGEQLIARGAISRVGPESGGTSATMAAMPATGNSKPDAPAPDGPADASSLTRAIQAQLARIGCHAGAEDGKWGQGVRRALDRYNVLAGKTLKTSAPSPETLEALTARVGLTCPP